MTDSDASVEPKKLDLPEIILGIVLYSKRLMITEADLRAGLADPYPDIPDLARGFCPELVDYSVSRLFLEHLVERRPGQASDCLVSSETPRMYIAQNLRHLGLLPKLASRFEHMAWKFDFRLEALYAARQSAAS